MTDETEGLSPGEFETLAELDFRALPRPSGVDSVGPSVELVRGIENADLPALAMGGLPADATPLARIRYSHHQAARLLGQGYTDEYTSLLTGYSPGYLRRLANDPSFSELMAYYASEKEKIYINVLERMRNIGLSALDELQHRLESKPDDWTKRELMELSQMTLVNPMLKTFLDGNGAAPAGGASGVSVNVTFVTPDIPAGAKIINGELAK